MSTLDTQATRSLLQSGIKEKSLQIQVGRLSTTFRHQACRKLRIYSMGKFQSVVKRHGSLENSP